MKEITEGTLQFSFPNGCQASKYDDWSFYRNQFQSVANGCKAVDIVCVADGVSWLVEVKDYREHPRTKPIDIADELAAKVRDTLAGLVAAASNANDEQERTHARQVLRSRKWRVVLHLEQPKTRSRLRKAPINPATLLQELKKGRKLKAIDADPLICDRNTAHHNTPWKAGDIHRD